MKTNTSLPWLPILATPPLLRQLHIDVQPSSPNASPLCHTQTCGGLCRLQAGGAQPRYCHHDQMPHPHFLVLPGMSVPQRSKLRLLYVPHLLSQGHWKQWHYRWHSAESALLPRLASQRASTICGNPHLKKLQQSPVSPYLLKMVSLHISSRSICCAFSFSSLLLLSKSTNNW